MDDSLLVRFVHGGANLFENIERPSDGEIFLLLEYLAERTSVEILHRQVGGPAVRRFCEAEVRYIDDIGVAETTRSPSFAAKALDKFGTLHELRGDNLDRDRALGAEMGRKIHGSHTATAKFAFDFIFVVERLPDEIRKIHKTQISISFDLSFTTRNTGRFSLFATDRTEQDSSGDYN